MTGAVSLFTPILRPEIFERWFTLRNLLFLWPVPLLVAATGLALLWAIRERRERLPFPLALALFVMSYIGLGISLYPNIVPPGLSFREAAAPDSSLAFLLAGAAPLIAIILSYTGYAYWVFRGKVGDAEGYH